ncbi:phage tail protein [Duganella sp. CY15W]|uniref:baseplate J/gp47 family protein n=1 Tax=Duganella sp. CY15W TaxID=2692172 RepID=UPI001369FF68|nr:baseplate J/gp47 family protein [Duganella sp. CY15W]MYM32270.1 phage tail protein [Duganella sp. CY15W]
MTFPTLSFEQIRDGMLRDILNQNPQAAVGADSDFRLRANSTAGAIEGLYQALGWTARQIFPDTADEDQMLQHAAKYGIYKKAATAATGTLKFSGVPGSTINAGVEGKALDGNSYVTTAAGIIGIGGTLVLDATAATLGFAGNQAGGTSLTLTQTPAGVSSTATIVAMASGTDIESSSAILARLLDRLRHPPAGGNKYDYRRWALEVPGVTSAWCYPLRRGMGKVDVAILSNGLPATRVLQNTVQAYLETVNPAGGDCQVSTPALVVVDVVAQVTLAAGVSLAAVIEAVRSVVSAYIAGLAPGATVLRGRILAAITDVPGVTDVTLLSPTASVVTRVDAASIEMAALGVVNLYV